MLGLVWVAAAVVASESSFVAAHSVVSAVAASVSVAASADSAAVFLPEHEPANPLEASK